LSQSIVCSFCEAMRGNLHLLTCNLLDIKDLDELDLITKFHIHLYEVHKVEMLENEITV
jgi:hypothetical protein